jgi:hypothetical protein
LLVFPLRIDQAGIDAVLAEALSQGQHTVPVLGRVVTIR